MKVKTAMMTAAFLAVGFEITRNFDKERYEDISDSLNGYVGIICHLAEAAEIVGEWMDKKLFEWPGVWEYEVVEPAGIWFFWHHDVSAEALAAHVIAKTEEWIKENEESESQ